jgi:urease accessory protein
MAAAPMPLAGFLSALQLSDSAFPSGRYTLSYGLEAFAQSGMVTVPADPTKLEQLLGDSLRYGVAPSDGTALACSHRAVDEDSAIDLELAVRADERLTAVKLAREGREASIRTGHALLGTATSAFEFGGLAEYADLVAHHRSPGNHAVVLGLVSGLANVPRVEAVAAELYAFSAGWVAAAVRLGLTNHRTAQVLLARVRELTALAALRAADRCVVDISSCTPLLDVMSMQHEEADLRLFAS